MTDKQLLRICNSTKARLAAAFLLGIETASLIAYYITL